jgi:hypothetical protein
MTAYYRMMRRDLAEAVRRGERHKAKRLTAKTIKLHLQLYGEPPKPSAGTPFSKP